jgi:hypothetical protein
MERLDDLILIHEKGRRIFMAKPLEIDEVWLERILNSINGLEYGTVQIVVHDGKIMQIERTERRRFESDNGSAKAKIASVPKKAKTDAKPK